MMINNDKLKRPLRRSQFRSQQALKSPVISVISMIMLFIVLIPQFAVAERVKDIASLQGVRDNQLIGYGLVVGLDGTGDATNQAVFTSQSFKNMLNKFGIRIPPGMNLQTKNIAAVMVSTNLPAFAKPGQTIDINVASVGNAKSLRGGTLLMTPLKAADGQVYAVAQGNLVVSGVSAGGADGSKVTVNVPSVGRIPNGATVERPSPTTFSYSDVAIYNLHRADFTTATRVAEAINQQMQFAVASAMDAGSIRVNLPAADADQVLFLAQIENLNISPADAPARIVVNARTGTVVIGQHVLVKPTAVSHGNLVVTVTEQPFVSQPTPFSLGQTKVVPDSQVQVSEEDSRAFVFAPGPSLQDIVQAVNEVGASPSDLVAILDTLKSSGALYGELVVI